jgi:hypothetical protein
MDVIVLTVIISMLLGAPAGILVGLAVAVIAAMIRSKGGLRERALGVLRTRFLWASATFSLAALLLDDWQSVAILWLISAFTINAWRRHGPATDQDRSRMLARFAAALTGLAMAWVTVNWVTTPIVAWLLAVALLAAGVFGMVRRWPALPWFAETFSPLRALGLTTTLGMCTVIVAVPFA